jgi:ribosomal protein L11 methyltransferase
MTKPAGLWRVEVEVPLTLVDAFAEALGAHCASVSWTLKDDATEAMLTGFNETKPDAMAVGLALAAVAEPFGLDTPRAWISHEAPRDWVVETAASFPPVEAGPFFFYGSHFEGQPPADKVSLLIDYGAAFGSGEHGSTKGCLLALAKLKAKGPVLDMGCGTGVLGLAIAKLRRLPVLAVDVDERAVAVTAENAKRNGQSHRLRALRSDAYRSRAVAEGRPYGLILSNILARPLMRMAPDLARHLGGGGYAVLSGFLERDAGRVLAAHTALGLRLVERRSLDGWTTLTLRKPA